MTKISIPFGDQFFEVRAPCTVDILRVRHLPPLGDVRRRVESALEKPVGSPPLGSIVAAKGNPEGLVVAVAVSDITRPVPYSGDSGILLPLLDHLRSCGIRRENIRIIVATGMHRPSTEAEKRTMFGAEVVDRYAIVDHDCDRPENLVFAGTTAQGTPVSVNRIFRDAGLRVCTGLVESHFMAGFSGGRKSVCPGLADKGTIERFHGPVFLENPMAANLVLDGNPCHEEAVEVARSVGVDFILNVTVDAHFHVTGIFAGHLEEAHRAACHTARDAFAIPLTDEYDIVLTHGGYVGMNHYQTAKAAVGALTALRQGGTLIIAADNGDSEPVGGPEYRTLLHLLRMQGPDGYVHLLRSPSWRFTKDQWEPEMWGKVLRKTGGEGLVYCSPQVSPADFAFIPGVNGYRFITGPPGRMPAETARLMVQGAVDAASDRFSRAYGRPPSLAFIADGPYAVPVAAQR